MKHILGALASVFFFTSAQAMYSPYCREFLIERTRKAMTDDDRLTLKMYLFNKRYKKACALSNVPALPEKEDTPPVEAEVWSEAMQEISDIFANQHPTKAVTLVVDEKERT